VDFLGCTKTPMLGADACELREVLVSMVQGVAGPSFRHAKNFTASRSNDREGFPAPGKLFKSVRGNT
jgi:hypothetical protein